MEEISVDLSAGMPLDEEDEKIIQDEREKRLTLKRLIVDPDLMQNGAELLQESGFFIDNPVCAVIWESVYNYFQMYRDVPSDDILLYGIEDELEEYKDTHPDADVSMEDIKKFIEEVKEYRRNDFKKKDTDKEVIHDYITEHLKDYAREVYDRAVEDGCTLEQAFSAMDKALHSDPMHEPSLKTPLLGFKDQMAYLAKNRKRSLFIPFLDDVLGGGMMKGETTGIVVPTNAGKTTLTWQLAYEHAMNKKHILIATLEQGYREDLSSRLAVLALGVSRTEMNKVFEPVIECEDENNPPEPDWDAVSDEAKERYEEAIPLINKYIHIIDDFADDKKPVQSLRGFYKNCFNQVNKVLEDEEIYTMVIDHWVPLRNKLVQAMPKKYDSPQFFRMYQQDIQKSFKSLSEEINTRSIVLHQMAGQKAAQKPGTRVSSHDSQEDKNFNNMFDNGIAVAQIDPETNRTKFFIDKARMGKKQSKEVELDGEHCRFTPIDPEDGGTLLQEMDQGSNFSKGFNM